MSPASLIASYLWVLPQPAVDKNNNLILMKVLIYNFFFEFFTPQALGNVKINNEFFIIVILLLILKCIIIFWDTSEPSKCITGLCC